MNNRLFVAVTVLLAFAALACPTRIVSDGTDGGSGGATSGGHSGSGGGVVAGTGGTATGGRGGQAGVSVGGASGGSAGGSGAGGAGGDSGHPGTGGDAGATGQAGMPGSGGAAGQGGAAGGGGAAGAAGAPSTGGAGGSLTKASDGQSCGLPADCASGTCTPFYVDLDGDGYGAGQAQGFCGTTAPIGYAAQTGDCCDTATNLAVAKLIHPGADFQTTSAGGVCNITWDYDCSGMVEQSAPNVVGCTPYPECNNVYGTFPDDQCGQVASVGACGISTTNTTACHVSGVPVGTLGCK